MNFLNLVTLGKFRRKITIENNSKPINYLCETQMQIVFKAVENVLFDE